MVCKESLLGYTLSSSSLIALMAMVCKESLLGYTFSCYHVT